MARENKYEPPAKAEAAALEDALIKAAKRIAKEGGDPVGPGGTVEYVDDDPSSGTVVFKDAQGRERAWMNAEDYLQMRDNLEAEDPK